jgi:hypothetical protein
MIRTSLHNNCFKTNCQGIAHLQGYKELNKILYKVQFNFIILTDL